MDTDLNTDKLGEADKNADTEYDTSRIDNTPDSDKANNTENMAKVCKSNLF